MLLALAAGFSACEDAIDLKVDEGKSYPVLDAWITNESGPQTIRFTQSVPYLDQKPAPVIDDAKITLFDLTSDKTFAFSFKNGAYSYDPGGDAGIGVIGHVYKLRVEYKGEIFEAQDSIKRVPGIDSISFEFKTKEDAASGEEGYYAKFHGRDIEGGPTDYYWIRSYRNTRSNRVRDGFAINGAYNEGVADGFVFIQPIAEGITDDDKPYLAGEKVIVRLASLTYPSHQFLTQVDAQLNNGGLFAKVLENVKSNAINVTPNGKLKVLGWFGASAVTIKEREAK